MPRLPLALALLTACAQPAPPPEAAPVTTAALPTKTAAQSLEDARGGCSAGSGSDCLALGLLRYYGFTGAASPSEAGGHFVRGCELGDAWSCLWAGWIISRAAVDDGRILQARACALGLQAACEAQEPVEPRACLSLDDVKQVLSTADEPMRQCYISLLSVDPHACGRAKLHLVVQPSGRLLFAEVDVAGDPLSRGALGQCVLEEVARLEFPPCPSGGIADVLRPQSFVRPAQPCAARPAPEPAPEAAPPPKEPEAAPPEAPAP